jgi:hypothetical protein
MNRRSLLKSILGCLASPLLRFAPAPKQGFQGSDMARVAFSSTYCMKVDRAIRTGEMLTVNSAGLVTPLREGMPLLGMAIADSVENGSVTVAMKWDVICAS